MSGPKSISNLTACGSHADSGGTLRTLQPLLPLWAAVLDDPETGLLVIDGNLHVLHITSQAQHLLGLAADIADRLPDLRQLLAASSLDPGSAAAAERLLSATEDSEEHDTPLILRHRSGRGMLTFRVRSVGAEYRVATLEDVSTSSQSRMQRRKFAVADPLTGLASRSYLESVGTSILARAGEEPVALLLLDLDRFKAVNDTLGHAIGDAVLRLAAERLNGAVRETDIAARLGGDEFAVLLGPSKQVEPSAVAKRISDLLQRTYLVEGQMVNVGVSIGIALAPKDGNRFDVLMKCADLALYQAKTSGRGLSCFFDPEMERRAQARRANELDLRRALSLRQLELHYQPQIDISAGRLVGFEALVRWRHPERGLVPPVEFLPVAEEIGVIVQIGDWVLRTACREAMNWPDNLVVAVNASPLQFDHGQCAESARRALAVTGLPGSRLEIEITEGIFLRNSQSVLKTLYALRAMGIRIAMDDFGTGYASLSQLANFPFDKIKIDKSLAGSEGGTTKHRAIVRAVSGMSSSLGISTTAEGVETAEQLARVRADGCTSVQGYYFGRPVPAAEVAETIARLHRPSHEQDGGRRPDGE